MKFSVITQDYMSLSFTEACEFESLKGGVCRYLDNLSPDLDYNDK